MIQEGAWRGWYSYRCDAWHHKMELSLREIGDSLIGVGIDDVGGFNISGHYDAATQQCSWAKRYGTHSVDYQGSYDGHFIRGSWHMRWMSGLFCIWPDGMDSGIGVAEEKQEPSALLSG